MRVNSLSRLILTGFPADYREVVGFDRPDYGVLFTFESLQRHGQLPLSNLVVGKFLQMCRKTCVRAKCNKPFCWIELVPLDGVTIIHGKLVMEVVITFAQSKKRSHDVIAWSMFVIVGRFPEPMSDGVD